MEDNTSVRKLVKLIFSRQFEKFEEMTALDSFIPTCLLENDFPRKLEDVLVVNQVIFLPEIEKLMNTFDKIMFTSCKTYLQCIIIACLTEAVYHKNVFEIFVSVCALLKLFNISIFEGFGWDLCELNADVFMVVYDDIMKRDFFEKGGFKQLAEFIYGHQYLSLIRKGIASIDAAAFGAKIKDIQAERESKSAAFKTAEELKTIKDRNMSLAEKVLSTTSFEFPTLSNNPELIDDTSLSENEENLEKNGKEATRKRATESIDPNETSQGYLSLNSDSRTDSNLLDSNLVNLPKNMPLLGKTIERVLSHYIARFGKANLDKRLGR